MGVVGAFGAVKRTRFLISDSSSRIAAPARSINSEELFCRDLFEISWRKLETHVLTVAASLCRGVGFPRRHSAVTTTSAAGHGEFKPYGLGGGVGPALGVA